MERDFMGLSSKEPLSMVQEDVTILSEGSKDMGFLKGSAVHWPFTNSRVSAFSYPNAFKFAQENTKIGPDSMATPGFMPLSHTDAYAASKKRRETEIQKQFNQGRNGGSHFPLNAYPMQQGHSVHRPHEVKMFPASNHAMSAFMDKPFFKNHAIPGQNMACTSVKPQPLGGIPVTTPHSIIPTNSSVAGITESCTKASGSLPQLTIFYAGTVNVFDDISPEKAQAIMFLAGKGAIRPSNVSQPKVQTPAASSKLATANFGPVNQSFATPPCSRLSSPLSISSQTCAQSGSGSTNSEEIIAAKTTGAATTPVSKPELQKVEAGLPSASAIPQARKASLARFLEKRKERVMSAAPYNNSSKKSPELSALESK